MQRCPKGGIQHHQLPRLLDAIRQRQVDVVSQRHRQQQRDNHRQRPHPGASQLPAADDDECGSGDAAWSAARQTADDAKRTPELFQSRNWAWKQALPVGDFQNKTCPTAFCVRRLSVSGTILRLSKLLRRLLVLFCVFTRQVRETTPPRRNFCLPQCSDREMKVRADWPRQSREQTRRQLRGLVGMRALLKKYV